MTNSNKKPNNPFELPSLNADRFDPRFVGLVEAALALLDGIHSLDHVPGVLLDESWKRLRAKCPSGYDPHFIELSLPLADMALKAAEKDNADLDRIYDPRFEYEHEALIDLQLDTAQTILQDLLKQGPYSLEQEAMKEMAHSLYEEIDELENDIRSIRETEDELRRLTTDQMLNTSGAKRWAYDM